jgi:hypothetical protein
MRHAGPGVRVCKCRGETVALPGNIEEGAVTVHNLRANPTVEIRDLTAVQAMTVGRSPTKPSARATAIRRP